jgi:hypothetical protein
MKIHEFLDFDHVVLGANVRLQNAIRGWKKGALMTEEALLSRLLEQFGHGNWRSDVGTDQKVRVTSHLAILHRKGASSTDKYGSDIAVTISIECNW